MDAVSNLTTAMQRSLKLGVVRCCKFDVEFRLDVFKFLFDGKGQSTPGRQGKLYGARDFPDLFVSGWSVTYDKHGDGCAVVFPLRLHPHVKFAPQFYSKVDGSVVARSRDFSEVVTVSVVKQRC